MRETARMVSEEQSFRKNEVRMERRRAGKQRWLWNLGASGNPEELENRDKHGERYG